MKRTTKKIIPARTLIPAALTIALVLAAVSCTQMTAPDVSGSPAGKGIVNIQLGGNNPGAVESGAARTLLPGSVEASAFDAYDLVFTVAEKKTGTPQTFTGVTSLTAALDAGTYDLVLTAKNGDAVAATGTCMNITVTDGSTTSVSVPLVFRAGAGTGTLSFSITRPSDLDLSDARFALTPLHSGTTPDTTDWLKIMYDGEKKVTHSSGEPVASGYYQAVVTLSTAERKAVKSDIVHIGAGQTTTLDWTFAETDFATIVDYIRLVGIPSWGTDSPSGVVGTANTDGTYTWVVNPTAPATFRFILDDTSTYEDKWWARWFHPETNNTDVSTAGPYEMKFTTGKPDLAWTLAAGYYELTVNPYAKTFTVAKPEHITGVTINEGNVQVNKGRDKTFTATVNGYNSPDQTVTWSIGSAHVTGTAFGTGDDASKLTIASDESAGTLTIRATSTADSTKYGEITVTVTPADTPSVDSVSVSAAGDATEVTRWANNTLQFTATVTVSHGAAQTVSWSVAGKDKDGQASTPNDGTTISKDGLLTVNAAEESVDLVVTATSSVSGFEHVKGAYTVFVRKYGDIYAIGNDFTNGWTNATSGSQMIYVSRGVYTLTDVLLTKDHTFKFRDNTVTDWNTGNWFHAGTYSGDDATTGEKWVGVRGSSSSESGDNNWVTTHGGKYTITLNTTQVDSMTVTFESTKQVIAITGGPSALAPNENGTFTYTATVTDTPVVWAVYGDNVDSHAPQTGTEVSNGILTLGSGEWITHTLYVTATSLGETVQSSDYPVLAVPVIDAEVYIVGFMNGWDNSGTAMIRGATDATRHLFTWTDSLSGDRDFRMHYGGGSAWERNWLVPVAPTNNVYGIHSEWCTNIPVNRFGGASTTDYKWQITSWGEGDYTITFNAAAKTLDVTKN